MPRLAEIIVYPLKGARAVSVSEANVVSTGLQHDRCWMVVKPDGTFVNQGGENRAGNHRIARVEAIVRGKYVVLTSPKNVSRLELEIADTVGCRLVRVAIFGSACEAFDLGDEAADWISAELGEAVRLVQVPNNIRRVAKYDPEGATTTIAFQDAGTMIATSKPSLEDLNARIRNRGKDPVPMNRFRPNLVFDGCTPYEEDTWRLVRIGDVFLHFTLPSGRCGITTLDQETGIRHHGEPLITLALYRRWRRPGSESAKPIFGMNVNHEGTGVLRVGDEIEVLERGGPFVQHGSVI
jgi:uncharacterized protein YcbX